MTPAISRLFEERGNKTLEESMSSRDPAVERIKWGNPRKFFQALDIILQRGFLSF